MLRGSRKHSKGSAEGTQSLFSLRDAALSKNMRSLYRGGGAATHAAIETLSKDIITNIHAMLVLNFQKQLRKAFKREILSYSTTRNFVFDTAERGETRGLLHVEVRPRGQCVEGCEFSFGGMRSPGAWD